MSGAIPLLPLYAHMRWTGKNFHLFTFILRNRGKQREITVTIAGNSVEMRMGYSQIQVLKMADMQSFLVWETCRSVVEKLLPPPPPPHLSPRQQVLGGFSGEKLRGEKSGGEKEKWVGVWCWRGGGE